MIPVFKSRIITNTHHHENTSCYYPGAPLLCCTLLLTGWIGQSAQAQLRLEWVRAAGGAGFEIGWGTAVYGAGNVYVSGYFFIYRLEVAGRVVEARRMLLIKLSLPG